MQPQPQTPSPTAGAPGGAVTGGMDPMIQQILQHVMDTHKHQQQQATSINNGLLGFLKGSGNQASPMGPGAQSNPAAPSAPQMPTGMGGMMQGGM